jgi:hypothetical protein
MTALRSNGEAALKAEYGSDEAFENALYDALSEKPAKKTEPKSEEKPKNEAKPKNIPVNPALATYGGENVDVTGTSKTKKASGGVEFKTKTLENGVKMIDLTKGNSKHDNFNTEGLANNDVDDAELHFVIHKTGTWVKGEYSEAGAAKGMNADGVFGFAANGTTLISQDRLFGDHDAASGADKDLSAVAIELGDKSLIGNMGTVIKKGDQWIGYIDSGVETGEVDAKGNKKRAQYVVLTEKDLNEFKERVGVENIEDAFVRADESDIGTQRTRNLGTQFVASDVKSRNKNAKATKMDIGNGEILVPKFTQQQLEDTRKIKRTVESLYEQNGKTVTWTETKHHGNAKGYGEGKKRKDQLKLEGAKELDRQIDEL